MQSNLTPGYGLWLESAVVLAVGTGLIVGLAALAGRLAKTAVWQRTIWQVTTVALLALLVVELTGAGSALVRLVQPARGDRPNNELLTLGWPAAARGGQSPFSSGKSSGKAESSATKKGTVPGLTSRTVPLSRNDPSADVVWTAPAATGSAWSERADLGSDLPAYRPFAETGAASLDTHGEGEELPPRATTPVVDRAPSLPLASASHVDDSPGAGGRQPASDRVWWPGAIWVLGAAVVAFRIAWARLLLLLFRLRHGPVSDEALRRGVGTLARRLGIRRRVALLEASGLTAPVAFGSLRPTLVLPAAFSGDFDRRQQEAMIAHELAHLAAWDPAWQLAADLTCAVLWWHPLSWWSRRRLRAAGEAVADEASMLVPEGPDMLASCLIALGRRLARARPQRLGWLSVEGPGFRSGLGRRVERLLSLSTRPRRAPRRGLLMSAKTTLPVALVIVAVLSTAWARPQALFAEGGRTMTVVQTCWRRSLAAAALAAFLVPISGDAMSAEKEGEEARPAAVGEKDAPAPSAQREAPKAEHPEAQQRERRERAEGEREFLMHQVEVLKMALGALREANRGDAVELVERAIRAREVTLEGRRDDEANAIRERAPLRLPKKRELFVSWWE